MINNLIINNDITYDNNIKLKELKKKIKILSKNPKDNYYELLNIYKNLIVNICYCRVSSSHQREDLKRQIEFLSREYPTYEIVSDVGSGLNWSRKGLRTILERALKGDVKTIVVTYKDRLCRFGFELIEFILEKSNTKLLVHNSLKSNQSTQAEKSQTETNELSEDLLSVITTFVARNNGKRSALNKTRRKEQEKTIEEKKQNPIGETSTKLNKKDKIIPKSKTTNYIELVV